MTYGLELKIYQGGRYTQSHRIDHVIAECDAQHLADTLRSLARQVERRAGLRPDPEAT